MQIVPENFAENFGNTIPENPLQIPAEDFRAVDTLQIVAIPNLGQLGNIIFENSVLNASGKNASHSIPEISGPSVSGTTDVLIILPENSVPTNDFLDSADHLAELPSAEKLPSPSCGFCGNFAEMQQLFQEFILAKGANLAAKNPEIQPVAPKVHFQGKMLFSNFWIKNRILLGLRRPIFLNFWLKCPYPQ